MSNTDLEARIARLESNAAKVTAPGTTTSPTPSGGTDQLIASSLLGLEAELRDAQRRKDQAQARAVEAAMTAELDRLPEDRRSSVLALMEVDRATRAQPLPQLAGPVDRDYGDDPTSSATAEVRRFRNRVTRQEWTETIR